MEFQKIVKPMKLTTPPQVAKAAAVAAAAAVRIPPLTSARVKKRRRQQQQNCGWKNKSKQLCKDIEKKSIKHSWLDYRKYFRLHSLRFDLVKLGLLLNNFADKELYTLVAVLLQFIAVVCASINTSFSPLDSNVTIEENVLDLGMTTVSDLTVCLPANSTYCSLYVKSEKNGLIALNESIYPALKAFNGHYDYRIIARINEFWLKFEPPTEAYYNTMTVLYIIIFFVGTTGNGLVIYMFARCKTLRSSPYMLVLNLAISDFLIVFKCPLAAFNNYMRGPVLGDWGCRIYGFIGGFSGTASIGMLTVIALDRYSVVVNPLNPNRFNCNKKYYACSIGFVWLYAFFFSSIPLIEIGLSRYVPEGYFTTCSFDYLDNSTEARVFMFIFFICAWLVPLSLICYCYFHILNVVFTTHKTLQSNKNKHKIEIRLAIVVLLVILLWFLSWTPYSIVAICGIFGYEEYLTPTRAAIPALFCKTASCLNPFLYTISHKRFRTELLRIFWRRKPRMHYSTTRSSFMTKSTRRQRNIYDVQNDLPATIMGGNCLRTRNPDHSRSLYTQRQYSLRSNLRSTSAPDGLIAGRRGESVKYARPINRSSMAAEENLMKYRRSPSSTRSIIAGQDGNRIYVIDAAAPEEDVIFIVSGGGLGGVSNAGVSGVRHSISTQVIVLHSDNNPNALDGATTVTAQHMETSF